MYLVQIHSTGKYLFLTKYFLFSIQYFHPPPPHQEKRLSLEPYIFSIFLHYIVLSFMLYSASFVAGGGGGGANGLSQMLILYR